MRFENSFYEIEKTTDRNELTVTITETLTGDSIKLVGMMGISYILSLSDLEKFVSKNQKTDKLSEEQQGKIMTGIVRSLSKIKKSLGKDFGDKLDDFLSENHDLSLEALIYITTPNEGESKKN